MKQYTFHYFDIDGNEYIEIVNSKPQCKGKEFYRELVKIIPCKTKQMDK